MLQLPGTPYRILEFLAVGGMAEIYLASEQLLPGAERLVVVKRLLPQHRDDEEYVTMFFDEARICSRLTHPNVVEVRAAFAMDGDCLIVFEHVDGVTLRQVMDVARTTPPGVIPAGVAAAVCLSLAETLAYVHTLRDEHGRPLNIVHRDLNPSNVVISRAGGVKLIDFGIARGEMQVHETATGMLKGTAGYMAPEQLQEGANVDARADVFNLGISLYELIAGAHPFGTRNPLEAFELIQNSRFESARSVRPDVAPALSELASRCLRANPDARPQSMHDVAAELCAYLRSAGVVPRLQQLVDLVAHSCSAQ